MKIKVYHVQVADKHYYFGSKKAIFDTFPNGELGINYNSLRNVTSFPYCNANCVIRKGFLIKTVTNRGKKLKVTTE